MAEANSTGWGRQKTSELVKNVRVGGCRYQAGEQGYWQMLEVRGELESVGLDRLEPSLTDGTGVYIAGAVGREPVG